MRLLLSGLVIVIACLQPAFAQSAGGSADYSYHPAPAEPPVVRFGGIRAKSATVDELMANPELKIFMDGKDAAPIRVTSFSVAVLRNGMYSPLPGRSGNPSGIDTVIIEDPMTGAQNMVLSRNTSAPPDFTIQGNRISPVQLRHLKTLKPGDKVFVDDIKATGPDGTARSLSPILLLIK